MDDYLKEALEITRAQAGVRVMSEEEIASILFRKWLKASAPWLKAKLQWRWTAQKWRKKP